MSYNNCFRREFNIPQIKTYYICGRYEKLEKEVIDEFEDSDQAKTMLYEYQLSMPGFSLWIEDRKPSYY